MFNTHKTKHIYFKFNWSFTLRFQNLTLKIPTILYYRLPNHKPKTIATQSTFTYI